MGDLYNNYQRNTSLNTHRAVRNDIIPAENDLNPSSLTTNTMLQTTTNIFIYSQGSIVGMIQSFTVNESRNINKLQAIGWEGVVQAVPSNTNGGTLNVNRIALYDSNIWNALGLTPSGVTYNPLGKKVHDVNLPTDPQNWDNTSHTTEMNGERVSSRLVFKTLKDQRTPLEILTKTRKQGSVEDYFIETYIDCWLQSYSKSYSVGTIQVAETAQISYADVY